MNVASTVNFGKIDARAILKFLFMRNKAAEIHDEMKDVLKNGGPSYSTVKSWVLRTVIRNGEDNTTNHNHTSLSHVFSHIIHERCVPRHH
ncbi:Hypothetical predicted protein [Octopus vulgaris]|uniref:Mos1 transposase HTH domain-containing protein n=1 Tax=Octopus vulgaris TaxID=6645 RepID=A0AA36BCM1_OCTVU|nr:Hypothetical predicted protein [Octopus vulgaris]